MRRLLLVCGIQWALCRESVAFDEAYASSTYAAVSFGAGEAVAPGSRYWCSSGGHRPQHVVTWSGLLDARVKALGLYLSWAYSPGESKVLCSADGANFDEAQPWRHTLRGEASFGQYFMFSAPRAVRAVTVALRAPRSWGYFGLRQAWLVALPGSFMIVSGLASPSGDLCLAALPGVAGAAEEFTTKLCTSAIAAADGAEVFEFDDGGQLVHALRQSCLTEPEAASHAQHLEMRRCPTPGGGDQLVWRWQSTGQLAVVGAGGRCLRLRGANGIEVPVLRQCEEADIDGRDTFFLVGVPEMSQGVASDARDSAAVLAAASGRLAAIVSKLHDSLQSCADAGASLCQRVREFGQHVHANHSRWRGVALPTCDSLGGLVQALSSTGSARHSIEVRHDGITDAVRAIDAELRLDTAGLQRLIAHASRIVDEGRSFHRASFRSKPLSTASAFLASVAGRPVRAA